jgi:hypothetical protein
MHKHLDQLMLQIEEQKQIPKKAPHCAKIGMSLAEQELLINKKLLEDIDREAEFPGQANSIKKAF